MDRHDAVRQLRPASQPADPARAAPLPETASVRASNPWQYLNTLRAGWWLIVLTVVLAAGGAIAYVRTAHKVYTAESDLLVTPLQTSDPTLLGLGLINASSDPTRAPATAARLVTTTDVALAVQASLGTKRSPSSLLKSIKVAPSSQTDVVSIKASASSPTFARREADAFAEVTIASRTARMHSVIDQLLPQLKATIASLPTGDPTRAELVQVELLSAAPDPTLAVVAHASQPTSPSSPRTALSLAIALLGGALLGVAGAFALNAVDPRLRNEEFLRQRYRLPVLGRIPKAHPRLGHLLTQRTRRRKLALAEERFRALSAGIGPPASDKRRQPAQALLVSGATPKDGSTMTAIGVARALASTGNRVLLLDADLEQPAIGRRLGHSPSRGLEDVAVGEVALGDALVTAMPGVRLLLPAEPESRLAWNMLPYQTIEELLETAKGMVNWIVIDAPPVSRAPDTLPFARLADALLVVVRLNHTRWRDLNMLSEDLGQHGIEPTGFVVMDAP